MRAKFNALILDTETCFKNEHNGLIAEIGWTFGNVLNKQDTPTCRRFLVSDTLMNPNYWLHTQKLKNVHESLAGLQEGERTAYKPDSRYEDYLQQIQRLNRVGKTDKVLCSWEYVLKQLTRDLSLVDCVGAYNMPFDLRAIQTTSKRFHHTHYGEIERLPHFCLMDMYANHVINRNYFRMIDSLDEDEQKFFLSKSGKNLGYSAEIMARYIGEDFGYIEEHTAMEDSLIEYELALHFLDKWKNDFFEKYLNKVGSVSWQSIRKRLTAKEKETQREFNFSEGNQNE